MPYRLKREGLGDRCGEKIKICITKPFPGFGASNDLMSRIQSVILRLRLYNPGLSDAGRARDRVS